MTVIPAGILLGARVSLVDWWWWNQLPVTLGNVVGGMLFTGLALHATIAKRASASAPDRARSAPLPDALPDRT